MAIAIPIALAAAYAVSRYRFPGRSVFMAAILSTQMFPGIFFLIPLFLLAVKVQTTCRGTGGRDRAAGSIFVYLSFALPLCIWVLAGYFASIPKDVEEAGMIDGLTNVSHSSGSSCRPTSARSSRSPSSPPSCPGARCCSPRC